MKKKILISLLCVFISISGVAQIQRTFFNLQLGISERSEVFNYFEKKGKHVIEYDDETLIVNKIRFGGEEWNTVSFKFYNNKLMSVSFIQSDQTTSQNEIMEMKNNLYQKLMKKYKAYYNSTLSDDEWTIFKDDATDLSMRYSFFEGACLLGLFYSDYKLLFLRQDNDNDEL